MLLEWKKKEIESTVMANPSLLRSTIFLPEHGDMPGDKDTQTVVWVQTWASAEAYTTASNKDGETSEMEFLDSPVITLTFANTFHFAKPTTATSQEEEAKEGGAIEETEAPAEE